MGFWIFMVVMNLLIPLSMIGFGKAFSKQGPGTINGIFGYRTARSMKNNDTWQFAHKYFGKRWYKLGWILLIPSMAGMLPVLGKDEDAVGTLGAIICTVQCIVMVLPIFSTEAALKKTFDKDGKRIRWEIEEDERK